MYSTLILALPEDDLSIIENVSEDDKICGHTAWTALDNYYEDDGVYRWTEVLHDLEAPQADGESGIQFLNRLVRLQRPLARVGDVVHDRRIIMYLVKSLRKEYHSVTDTWDVYNLSMDTVKRDLRQKGMRIESRAQSRTTEPPTPTAFAASHDDATTKLLKQVSELQDQLHYIILLLYSRKSTVSYFDPDDVALLHSAVLSRTGVRQGDPLGPLLFNLVINTPLLNIGERSKDSSPIQAFSHDGRL
jgi:hypothetical protein